MLLLSLKWTHLWECSCKNSGSHETIKQAIIHKKNTHETAVLFLELNIQHPRYFGSGSLYHLTLKRSKLNKVTFNWMGFFKNYQRLQNLTSTNSVLRPKTAVSLIPNQETKGTRKHHCAATGSSGSLGFWTNTSPRDVGKQCGIGPTLLIYPPWN